MGNHGADVCDVFPSLEYVEVIGERFPVTGDAFAERRTGNVWETFRQVDQEVVLIGLGRGEVHSAVSHHQRRDAMRCRRLELSVPSGLAVVVSMNIDKARCEEHACRVDLATAAGDVRVVPGCRGCISFWDDATDVLMLIETLLPLGKLDPGLREPDTPLDIRDFARLAKVAEDVGVGAVLVEETKDDPYQLLALGAMTTERVQLGTSVAMAFPRSPTATAMSAWSLQKLSNGRFMLGLGTQVRAHIQRRYGLEWHAPAPWMRDYVNAMRAVWNTWQTGEPLKFESQHYNLDVMVPLFDPGPIDHPDIPIHVAAIGPNMCAVAGEVADGIRLHPVCTAKYIDVEVLPNVIRGAARTGRNLNDVEVCLKPLIGTAPDEERLVKVIDTVRARVAFYLSTPSYRRAFEVHGWGEIAREASTLSRAQRWDDLPGLVNDEMLHTVATIATYDGIADKLNDRFADRLDRIEFSIPVNNADDADAYRQILGQLR